MGAGVWIFWELFSVFLFFSCLFWDKHDTTWTALSGGVTGGLPFLDHMLSPLVGKPGTQAPSEASEGGDDDRVSFRTRHGCIFFLVGGVLGGGRLGLYISVGVLFAFLLHGWH